jgi:hypothetical protein
MLPDYHRMNVLVETMMGPSAALGNLGATWMTAASALAASIFVAALFVI